MREFLVIFWLARSEREFLWLMLFLAPHKPDPVPPWRPGYPTANDDGKVFCRHSVGAGDTRSDGE